MSLGRELSVITFLFTDIVGSTQLHDVLGDEAAQEIVRRHNQLVRAEVTRHGGSEVKSMGDGFMIAFQSVTSALNCAVAIQRAIEQHNREEPTLEFAVRMGLNAGEAIQEREDFFGTPVIVAARIAAMAGASEILASATVKQLAQGMRGIEYRFKGEFQLKGLREPHPVYEVIYGPAELATQAALRRPRFVGRQAEMEDLKRCLEQTASGSGTFVLLTGESGVGKTRLAEEFGLYARTRGFRVHRGRCQGTEGAPPYTPFIEIIRQYIEGRPDDALEDELADFAEEIARLVPELVKRISVKRSAITLPPEQERYRIMEAVRRLLEQTARRRPLLLVLDDGQWADPASGLLLRHLAASIAAAPVMVLCTCTTADLGAEDALTSAIAEFGRLQAHRTIALSGLTTSVIRDMLNTMGAGEIQPGLAEAVHQETEGNPFFVTELIRHLDSTGALLDENGQWRRDFAPGDWDIPESVRVVIQRRLGGLSEDARRVLTVAAVAGRDFTYDLLEAVGEVPPESLLDGLDEGIRIGMIEETEGVAACFRFSHQMTRQTLYDQLSALRRQRQHLRIGEALERLEAGEPEAIAHQLRQAGSMAPADKTQRYLALAGDKARRMAAWEAAAGYYSQALELTPAEVDQERARLLRALGEAEGGRGNWEKAVDCLNQAMALFEKLGDVETVGSIAYYLRRLYGARGQFEEASAVVQHGLDVLGDADSEGRARLLAQAGFIRSAFGEADEAERLLAGAMETAERLDNPAAKGFAAFIRGMHCLNYARLSDAAGWLTKGTEWSLAGDDPWSASQGSSFRRHILFALGDLREAERDMDQEERLARKAGNFLAVCETKWISAGVACLRGDLERAEDMARQLLHLIEASQADSGIPGALVNLAYIRFLRGDNDAYENLLASAIETYDRMSAAPIDDPRPVLLLLRAMSGSAKEARAMLPGLDRYFNFEDHWTMSLGEARITLGAALGALGECETAATLYTPLKEWTGATEYVLTGASSIPALVSRALAMTACTAGLEDEARGQYETAMRQAREMELDTELAETSYWYARHLLKEPSGDHEYARDLLSDARHIWERLGMSGRLTSADELSGSARNS